MLHRTTLRAAPHGRPLAQLTTKTQFGSPETALVVRHVPGWLGVVATQAGNGKIGWIPLSAVSLARVNWEIKVSLSARRLTVLDAGKVLKRYTVAIGRPGAPTPTGRFAVTDRLVTGDPAGPYGCCILALSAQVPARDPGLERRGPHRDPLHSRDVEHRRGGEPWLPAVDARRGALAARSRPARHPDADPHLSPGVQFSAFRVG